MKIEKQRDWKDCGVCALLSIIKYYGGYVPLEQLRMDAKATNDGTTALNLILASKKYGFDAVGLKVLELDNIKTLPAIAHLNLKNGMNHYVVIYKITKSKVILMDPAKGKVIKSRDEFMAEWSNIILAFYPHQKITLLKKENTLIKLFRRILIAEKKLVGIIILISVFLSLFTIVGGYYFQVMGSAISNHYDSTYIKILILIFGIIVLFKIGLTHLRNYFLNHLNKNIDCILNIDFLNHLYHLPLNVLTSRTAGEIVTRVGELTNIKSLITELFVTSTLDFFLMFASMPLLINISSNLFLVLFLSVLIYLIIGIISSKMIYQKAYQNIEYEADFNNVLLEDINMVNSIKNLQIVDNRLNRVESFFTKFLYDGYLLNDFLNKEQNLKNIVQEISFFVVNTWGLWLVLQNKLSLVEIVTFNTLLTLFFEPLKNLINSLPKYNFLKATITKINDFLSVKVESEGKAQVLNNFDIEVKNLRYSYNHCQYLIDDLNMSIKSGEFITLSGPSGSGKSTLCKILDKYITEYEGEIYLGGINIKDLSVATVRSNILYVNQQEAIFSGTIRENITLNADITEERFQHICNLCKVDTIVLNKELRYDSWINDDAATISGGEKERIILARALLKDFQILILDEALSEVDYKLEHQIMKNLKHEFSDKTIIYISHKKHQNIYNQIINIGGKYDLSRSY